MKQRRKRCSKRLRDEILSLTKELKIECQLCYENSKVCTLNHSEFDCQEESCEDCSYLSGNCNPNSVCPGMLDPVLIARARLKGENWTIVK